MKVTLGEVEYHCYPQRIGYLKNRLDKAITSLAEEKLDNVGSVGDFVGLGGHQVYVFLKVFYPALMPEWQFEGYGDEPSWNEGIYSEENDRSPSLDQIITAFDMALKVNRLDALKALREAVPFDSLMATVRTMIRARLAEVADRQLAVLDSPGATS